MILQVSGLPCDQAHHTSGSGSVTAVGGQKVGTAGGAQAGRCDPTRGDTAQDRLAAIGCDQVDPRPPLPLVDTVRSAWVGAEKCLHHLVAYLEAAGSNRRPNGQEEVIGAALEGLPQRFQGGREHPGDRPAPPGVNRRECPLPWIADEYRQAVGDPDPEGEPRPIGDQGISLFLR